MHLESNNVNGNSKISFCIYSCHKWRTMSLSCIQTLESDPAVKKMQNYWPTFRVETRNEYTFLIKVGKTGKRTESRNFNVLMHWRTIQDLSPLLTLERHIPKLPSISRISQHNCGKVWPSSQLLYYFWLLLLKFL